MRSLQWCALALSTAATANAYLDTSPFSLYSTSELSKSDKALASAESVTTEISDILSSCASDHYIIVSQPGVSASDYKSLKRASALREEVKSTVFIPDVIGAVDTRQLKELLHSECGAEVLHIDAPAEYIQIYQGMPKVIDIAFTAPSPRWKRQDLQYNDDLLAALMESLRKTNYTVVWTTSPPVDSTGEPSREYNMEDGTQESLHTGMKRNLGSGLQRRETNVTLVDGPLFHRYQFFTPGIFMGFLVGFILLMLLYVGISALASLQVTYAAFDKEQGALAKTKAQ